MSVESSGSLGVGSEPVQWTSLFGLWRDTMATGPGTPHVGIQGRASGVATFKVRQETITIIRLGDRGPEIDQVQHYSNITQGQEERIPKI